MGCIVRYLIDEKRVNINQKNSNGNTALIDAKNNGRTDVVRFLESKGALRRRREIINSKLYKHFKYMPPISNQLNTDWKNLPYYKHASINMQHSKIPKHNSIKNITNLKQDDSQDHHQSNSADGRYPSASFLARFSNEVCVCNNTALLSVLRNLIDVWFPLPKFDSITDETARASALEITERYKNILVNMGYRVFDVNFYDLYKKITELVKNETFSQLKVTLLDFVKDECPTVCENIDELKLKIDNIFENTKP